MFKYTNLILLLMFAFLVSCQKPQKKLTVSQFDPSSQKFFFLNEAIKDVKILSLGESSHGFGSMHTLKGDLVKYLHNELGFDLFIIEAGYGDVGISWFNIEHSTPTQLINSTVSGNLRSEEMLPLFEYLKEKRDTDKPLEFGGMDSRLSGVVFNYRLMTVIKKLEPTEIQDSISNGLREYSKSFEALDNEEAWQSSMDRYLDAIGLAKNILVESRNDIQELELAKDKEVDILIKYLDMLAKAVDYKFGETYTRGLTIRDSLMAENVFAFAKEFPKSKIIIWGHNGHIEKGACEGDNTKWVGHYLKEKYGDAYYALGMFAKKGFIYQSEERITSNFDLVDPSFLEVKLYSEYGKNVFLDLPKYDETNNGWTNKPIFGYELEAGGKVSFIPSKRFDGILLLGETKGPTYLINTENPRR